MTATSIGEEITRVSIFNELANVEHKYGSKKSTNSTFKLKKQKGYYQPTNKPLLATKNTNSRDESQVIFKS